MVQYNAAPSHSEHRESHNAASSVDRGRKEAPHFGRGGNTGLTEKDSLTFSHCAAKYVRHAENKQKNVSSELNIRKGHW